MSSGFEAAARKTEAKAERSGGDHRLQESFEAQVGVPPYLQESVQCRLVVGAPDDGLEREADVVAKTTERSTSADAAPHVHAGLGQGPRTRSSERTAGPLPVSRVTTPALRRDLASDSDAAGALPYEGAAPLRDHVRSRIEPVLGVDLSGVRVHSGASAARAAGGLRARAFTRGNDIWLGERASPDDVELMAHEATHVVQQRAAPTPVVQRRPEDYIHPEDGATVQSNMSAAVEEELAEVDESDREDAPAPDEMPARERSRLEGELADDGELPADRAAEARPEVETAANEARSEADQPPDPLAEAAEQEPDEGAEGELADSADVAADFAAAASPPPEVPTAVAPLVPEAPTDSEGGVVPADGVAEAATVALTAELQRMRNEGFDARTRASVIHGNAGVMRGNLRLAQSQVDAADQALHAAEENLESRRDIAGQGREALAVSEEKAAQVAAEAPDFVDRANEAHEDSGPIASEAAELSGEAAGQDPEDAEAAGKMQRVGGQMSSVGSDAATIDGAVTQTHQRAESLAEDAALAQEKNTETAERLDSTEAALDQADERLAQLGAQNQLANTQIAGLMAGPGQLEAGAEALDAGAVAAIDHSLDLERELRATEGAYEGEIGAIPGAKAVAAAAEGATGGADGIVQRSPEDPYADRVKVDLLGAFRSPASAAALREQEERRLAADLRRRERIRDIQRRANGDFSSLSELDRMSIALELTGENLWSGASEINWPNMAQQVILAFIDPSVSLEGVVTGLNGVLSGAANLLSLEQWERDPLGNLLKSSADIATGLTTILGSIAGLCTAILVILGALAIFTFGAMGPAFAAASAFLGPIISTVGGWALVTAAIAAELHALVFIKNLIDAATAETAEAVVNEAGQMTEDATQFASAASEVVLDGVVEAGGARLANTPTGQRIGGAIEGVGRDFDMIPPPRVRPDMDLPPATALSEAPPAAAVAEAPSTAAVVEPRPGAAASPDAAATVPVESPPAAAIGPEPAAVPVPAAPPAAVAPDTAPPSPVAGRTSAAEPAPGAPPAAVAPEAAPPAPVAGRTSAAEPAPAEVPPASSLPEVPAASPPAAAPRETASPAGAVSDAAATPSGPRPETVAGPTAGTGPSGTRSGGGAEPPRPTGGEGGGGGAPPQRLGGATAEGVGPDFTHETFPPTRMPEVQHRRPRGAAEGPTGRSGELASRPPEAEVPARGAEAETPERAPTSDSDLTAAEADLLADAIDAGDLSRLPPHLRRRAETAATQSEATGGPSRGEPGQRDVEDITGPSRPQTESGRSSAEVARDAGVPETIYGDGYVFTSQDFPDVVPDRPIPPGRQAPDPLPTPGRQVGRSQLQNTDVQADIFLLDAELRQAGATIEHATPPHDIEARINQTQTTAGPDPTRTGTNRPDLQATLPDGRRIYVEYDRAPGTRAMDHARRILANDPDGIVILKIIDFDVPRRRRAG